MTLVCSLGFSSLSLAQSEGDLPGQELTETDKRQFIEDLFRQAMEKRESGNIYSAIEDFQTILSAQSELHRARLEMAVAYYQAYKFEQAINEAQYVLDDPETPPNVRVSILAFLAQVKQDAQRLKEGQHTWRFPIRFGYVYDTNVNIGPDSTVIGDIVLRPDSKKKSDSGRMFSVGASHTYQTGKRYNFGPRPTSLLWQSGFNVYHRGYNDEDDFNLSVISLRTGPTFVTTGSWRANITLQEDIIRYGDEQLAYYTYLLPSFTWHFGDTGFESTIDAVITRRDYTQDRYQGRDSVYLGPRASLGYTFYNGNMAIQGGIQYINENADDSQYSSDGLFYFINGNWKFTRHSNIYLGYTQLESWHDGPVPVFNKTRDESTRRHTFGISHTIQEFGLLSDWTLSGEVAYTERESTIDAYDYTRTRNYVTLSRRF